MTVYSNSKFRAIVIGFLGGLLSLHAAAQDGTMTQDINTLQDFSLQPQCVQSCFQMSDGVCPMDLLGIALGCASLGCDIKSWQAKNDCYCRLDFQQPAQDYMGECITSSCTVGDPAVAAGSAGSIYRRYCEEKGYDTTTPASVDASTTALTKPSVSTRSKATPTATSPTEEATTSPASSENQGGISTAALAGIIVGAVIGIAILVGLVWWCRGRRPPAPAPPPPYPYYPLNTNNVNRLHELKDLRVGDSVSNFGSQAPPPMLLPPRPLAPPGSVQSGSTGMAQPYVPLR